jgi:hypothetical protein
MLRTSPQGCVLWSIHRSMLPSTHPAPPRGPGDRTMTKIGYAAMLEQFHPTDLLD